MLVLFFVFLLLYLLTPFIFAYAYANGIVEIKFLLGEGANITAATVTYIAFERRRNFTRQNGIIRLHVLNYEMHESKLQQSQAIIADEAAALGISTEQHWEKCFECNLIILFFLEEISLLRQIFSASTVCVACVFLPFDITDLDEEEIEKEFVEKSHLLTLKHRNQDECGDQGSYNKGYKDADSVSSFLALTHRSETRVSV